MLVPGLTVAAAKIARNSPEHWSRFLAELRAYTNQQRDNCINAPSELLPVMQGRAQIATQLSSILEACLADADKMERKPK